MVFLLISYLKTNTVFWLQTIRQTKSNKRSQKKSASDWPEATKEIYQKTDYFENKENTSSTVS